VSTQANLAARALSIGYLSDGGTRQVVSDVDLLLEPNRIVGLAGESGCGKSTLSLSMVGYRSPNSVVMSGSVDLGGQPLSNESVKHLRKVWGIRVAYMPQDASTALNPAMRVGNQIEEVLRLHLGLDKRSARERSIAAFEQVGVPDPKSALRRYPHQFSGGQQQRIALAMALSCEPEALILDEPTTGLDVTTQARVNRLIVALARQAGTATLYVSHNLALLATVCDELAIMYGGEIVERGPAREVYLKPRHPYTAALIAAVPDVRADERPEGIPGAPPPVVIHDRCGFADRCTERASKCLTPIDEVDLGGGRSARCIRVEEVASVLATPTRPPALAKPAPSHAVPLLEAREIRCAFRNGRSTTVAVDDVSIAVQPGRVLGIAGESGSGKSTLLRTLAGIVVPKSGELRFQGEPMVAPVGKRPKELRKAIQIVFQNPDSTLNPRLTVMQSLERPLRLFRRDLDRAQRRDEAAEMLKRMRLPIDILDHSPRNLSGGQRQRVALARALLADPSVLLCDEVTSALDVSVQATILELLAEMIATRETAVVFVTHDLGVLRSIADEAVVLERGQVRERGQIRDLLDAPQHPYTRDLIASVPDPHAVAAEQ
jgi:peptide/nickel transport system ATP-binding protein